MSENQEEVTCDEEKQRVDQWTKMAGKVEQGKAASKNHVMNDILASIGVGNQMQQMQGEGKVRRQPGCHGQSATKYCKWECGDGKFEMPFKK